MCRCDPSPSAQMCCQIHALLVCSVIDVVLPSLAPFSCVGFAPLCSYGSPFESYRLTRRRAIRRMLEHNAKIIHGVPKHQLLVWDVHRFGTQDVDALLVLFCVMLRRTIPKGVLLKCAWDRCRWAGGSSLVVAGVTGTRTGGSCVTFSASPCPRCPSQPPSPRIFRLTSRAGTAQS